MAKKTALILFATGILVANAAYASEYGLCINRSRGDQTKQAECNNDETRRLMRQINQKMAQIARIPQFGKINQGKTSLNDQFKYWQAFRNNYCAYVNVSSGAGSDGAYFQAECIKIATQNYNEDLDRLLRDIYADPE